MGTTSSNSIVAAEHNIICMKGDTFARQFRYFQDEAKTLPLDITGSTFKLTVRDLKANKTILSFTLTTGLSFTDTNKLNLAKTATEMNVAAGIYCYDLEKTTGADVVTIMKGRFEIHNDITG